MLFMFESMDFTILVIILEYIAITYAFGLIYKLVGWKNSVYIQRNFGWTGYCVVGSVGVTYHELSHLITAVLFRHKINEVRLFRPFQGRNDGTLGYVTHSWNGRSMFQRIGNFFIGTAPMFLGAGLLFILLQAAYPSAFISVAHTSEIPGALKFTFVNMFVLSNLFTMWTPIVFLIAISICPYMDMSWADVKGSTSGAITLIIAALILSLVLGTLGIDVAAQIQSAANTFIAYYIYALVLGLCMSIVMTLFLGVLSIMRGKGL